MAAVLGALAACIRPADDEANGKPAVKRQRISEIDGKPFPKLVECPDKNMSLEDAVAWVSKEQDRLKKECEDHGACLFRGFPLKCDKDFDAFVSAFKGWKDLPYDESLSFAVRQCRTARVCTTNEGKSGGLIFHHEQAQAPLFPSKVFFFCEKPAASGDGGQTGLSPSWMLLRGLKEKYPDFVKKCAEHGVKYSFTLSGKQDTSKGSGRSWRSYFSVQTEEQLEKRLKELGYTWEWQGKEGSEDRLLNATTPVLSAVRTEAGREVFFNQMMATIANCVEFAAAGTDGGGYITGSGATQDALDKCLRFGDGSSVDLAVLQDAIKICESYAVDVEWEQGDVALIDNMTTMHARRTWSGPAGTRLVLASLVK